MALLERAGDVGSVLDVVGELPVAVFWSCPKGDAALHGHLRRLNRVLIPCWAAAGKTGPEVGSGDGGLEAVMFRHWDPRVLGALLPALNAGQFSHILGPAGEIVFHAQDYGGTKRVVSDPAWPKHRGGILVIRGEQIEALVAHRLDASHRRVAAYLGEAFPEAMPAYPGSDLMDFVRDADVSGRELGIKAEAGHKRWAYLVMASEGQVSRTPGALHFIQHEGQSPDDQVRRMMEMLSAQVGRSRRPGGTG